MIYTFYSFKGGVGRSMAVANVAEWFHRQGLRVVVVDWDLEAPGLESFFLGDKAAREAVRARLGIIDVVQAYQEQFPYLPLDAESRSEEILSILQQELPPLKHSLIPVREATSGQDGGAMWLLSAGARPADGFAVYAEAVQRLNWAEFYAHFMGHHFVEWIRSQLNDERLADVVIVDSRTGVTEVGGVCTRQLADVVVTFCVPNIPNLGGVDDMVSSFGRNDLAEVRGGRELQTVIVPTRIENSEIDARNRFEQQFRELLDRHTPFRLKQLGRDFWDLRIPYVPKYAYVDELAIGGDEAASELVEAYERLGSSLSLLAPKGGRIWEVGERALVRGATGSGLRTISNVPPPHRNFIDRPDLLAAIKTSLASTHHCVVTGLGGAGKSQIAKAYAQAAAERYSLAWWVRAEDLSTARADLAELASRLQLIPPGTDVDTANSAVIEWLEVNPGWLVIFDGVEDAATIRQILPRGNGDVLITTRNPAWGGFGIVDVGVLSLAASTDFLLRQTGDTDRQAAADLAHELGYLPLALQQASAYINETGRSISHYLAMLRDRRVELLQRGDPGDYAQTVASTFAVSFEAVEARSPTSAGLLRLLSFMGSHDFPRQYLSDISDRSQELLAFLRDPLVLDEAVAGLRRYSLLDIEGGNLWVHRLVQALARSRLGPEDARKWSAAAVRLVAFAFPNMADDPSTWPQAAALLPHVIAATQHATALSVISEECTRLLLAAGSYLHRMGRLQEALSLAEEALSIARDVGDRQGELVALGNLGSGYFDLGDLHKAINLYEQALVIAHEIGDPHGESVALNNLGSGYSDLGHLSKAIDLFEQALLIAREIGDRLAERVALVNLGSGYSDLGDLSRAINLFEQALVIAREIGDRLGERVALDKLGSGYSDLGDLSKAIDLYEQALVIAREIGDRQGERVALNNLGSSYSDLGEPSKAIELHQRALIISEAAFGPEHPQVAVSLTNLGNAYQELGEYQRAIELHKRALTISEAVFGPDHPQVGVSLTNLGNAYQELGERQRAIELHQRALTISESALGPDHPEVAVSLTNLGNAYQELGEYQRAIELHKRALTISEAVFGPDHPQVAVSLTNLGNAYQELGERQRAIELHKRAAAINVQPADEIGSSVSDAGVPKKR